MTASLRLEDIAPLGPHLGIDEFLESLQQQEMSIFDVRSPQEFYQNAIPTSLNVPILDDEERRQVGICYKHVSKEKAISMAYEYAQKKEADFLRAFAGQKKVIIYCWRGGGRSRYVAHLLRQKGIDAVFLQGGQKAFRTRVYQALYIEKINVLTLSGLTGVGKSELLELLQKNYPEIPVLHIEKAAGHASSVFGEVRFKNRGINLPSSQEKFESHLYLQMLPYFQHGKKIIFLAEAESRKIGNFVIPPTLMQAIAQEEHIEISCSLPLRIQRLQEEYFPLSHPQAAQEISHALEYLKRVLGGEKLQQYKNLIKEKKYADFLQRILLEYYDKNYRRMKKEAKAKVEYVSLLKAVEQVIKIYNDFKK
ncbi:MAG: tRNA 2-selenouridine(34) synthase MnmH [Bacteriovoracaceae bacterium]|nr:tRNA 2-selenouridine(34) synthase MnmH [Bacteriovoracaceae bacterium]